MVVRPGRVIVVNGASSSGKSTICRALQTMLREPHLFTGIDHFTPMLPPLGHLGLHWRLRTNDNAGEGAFRWVFPEREGDLIRLEVDETGHRLVRGMHRAIAALANAGNNVIVEHVLLFPEWLDDLQEALAGLEVRYVAVRCPIEIVEAREISRADRIPGQSREHHERVHERVPYEIDVDSSRMSPGDAAKLIIEALPLV